MNRRRWLGVFCLLGLLVFLLEAGWFSSPISWQQSSGWSELDKQPQIGDHAGPQISWLGHSGFLLTWHGKNIVLDPNLSDTCVVVKRLIKQERPHWPGPIDVALVSHAHYDHFDLPTLQSLPGLKTIIAPTGLDGYLPKDLARVEFMGMNPGKTVQLGRLTVVAVPAIHGGNRFHPFRSVSPALGYIIGDGVTSLYFAGDTAYGDHFKQIAKDHQPQIAILPIGAYEPHFVLRDHHMNPEEAVRAAVDLGVGTVIPCHFGTFRLAFDRPDSALPRFAKAAEAETFDWYLPPLLGQIQRYGEHHARLY